MVKQAPGPVVRLVDQDDLPVMSSTELATVSVRRGTMPSTLGDRAKVGRAAEKHSCILPRVALVLVTDDDRGVMTGRRSSDTVTSRESSPAQGIGGVGGQTVAAAPSHEFRRRSR